MSVSTPLSLSELQILNQEILAAVRSGVSIDLGIRESAQTLPGRLSLLADQLAHHLAGGKSLDEALNELIPPPPAIYRVVVAAGIRGNQLESVLIRLNEYARVLNELRESLRRAAIYPIAVASITFLMTCLTTYFCVPALRGFLDSIRIKPSLPVKTVYWLHDTMSYWVLGIPALIVGFWMVNILVDWWQSGTVGTIGFLRYLPGFRRLMANAELSRLASLLAIQIEYGLPLPESLRRSADAVASPRLQAFCLDAADRVERGEPFGDSLTSSRVVPAFMKWMLSVPHSQEGLVFSCSQAAEIYRERSILQSEWIERMAPAFMVLFFGVTVVGLFCWAVMGTLITIWNGVA